MIDLALLEENELKNLCKDRLKSVPEKVMMEFVKSIFPVNATESGYALFFGNLNTFYTLRISKRIQFDQITKEFLKKAKDFNHELYLAIEALFKTDFMGKFRRKVTKGKEIPAKSIQKSTVQKANGKDTATEQIVSKSGSDNSRSNPITLDNKSVSSSSSLKASTSIKRQPLTLVANNPSPNSTIVSESGIVTNLSDQDMCFCGKHISLIESSKQLHFHCYHCNKRYHTDCMKRTVDSKCCSFCHLRKLLPNRETKKTVFVGLLNKGRKKHEINFYLSEEDLSIQFKIQVRCFRIKQTCQNSTLFPDSVSFSLKNVIIKDFLPLHKQSSLKYRKDEPFYLSSGLNFKQNKLIVAEKHPSKETRDDRIDLETHLIGIYVIQEKKVEWLVRDMKISGFNTFSESKELLSKAFKVTGCDEISCELIKISLCCSLSIDKLKLPARGIFCLHYQCFDLKNFLDLTVNSSNPRWLCPICKFPAYQFKIDVILFSILEVYKQFDNAVQAIFLKNGEFKVFSSDSKQCQNPIKSIFELPIDDKLKRGDLGRKLIPQEQLKKKAKNEVAIS